PDDRPGAAGRSMRREWTGRPDRAGRAADLVVPLQPAASAVRERRRLAAGRRLARGARRRRARPRHRPLNRDPRARGAAEVWPARRAAPHVASYPTARELIVRADAPDTKEASNVPTRPDRRHP